MDMSPQQFASHFGSGPKNNALLIGFEGTRTLLGHPTVGSFLEKLHGDANVPMCRAMWKLKKPQQRRDLMEIHTKPSIKDNMALDYLARLLSENYIRVIITADESKGLYEALRERNVDIEYLHCFEYLPTRICQAFTRGNKSALIDGVYPLIRALYEPDDQDKHIIKPAHAALKACLSPNCNISNLLVWQWSQCNSAINFIINTSEPMSYYLLNDQDLDIQDGNVNIITPESTTTIPEPNAVIKQIGFHMWGTLPPPTSPSPTTTSVNIIGEDGTRTSPCLLISPGIIETLVSQSNETGIIVIGVDGELVRSRVAEHARLRLRERKANVVPISQTHSMILQLLSTLERSDHNSYSVVELSLGPDNQNTWANRLEAYSGAYSIRAASLSGPGKLPRIMFIVPRSYAVGIAGRNFPEVSNHILDWETNEANVTEWLGVRLQAFGHDSSTLANPELSRLSQRMVQDARRFASDGMDWIHQTLDRWAFQLEYETQGVAGTSPWERYNEVWRKLAQWDGPDNGSTPSSGDNGPISGAPAPGGSPGPSSSTNTPSRPRTEPDSVTRRVDKSDFPIFFSVKRSPRQSDSGNFTITVHPRRRR